MIIGMWGTGGGDVDLTFVSFRCDNMECRHKFEKEYVGDCEGDEREMVFCPRCHLSVNGDTSVKGEL